MNVLEKRRYIRRNMIYGYNNELFDQLKNIEERTKYGKITDSDRDEAERLVNKIFTGCFENCRDKRCLVCNEILSEDDAIKSIAEWDSHYIDFCEMHWEKLENKALDIRIGSCLGECSSAEMFMRPFGKSLLCGQPTLPGKPYCNYHMQTNGHA